MTSGLRLISSAASSEIWSSRICQLPCFSRRAMLSPRSVISAELKMVVTKRTAIVMHSNIIRFWRLRTLAEIGIRSR